MSAMPDISPAEPPGPMPDPVNPETLLRQQFIEQAVGTLDTLVAALKGGHNPVRTLYLIETYAASIKAHIAEVDSDEPPPMDQGGGGNLLYAGGGGAVQIGARRARAGGVNMGFPVHGGAMEPIRQMMGVIEGLNDTRKDADRTKQIRDLTESIANARTIEDDVLEAQLRDELRLVMNSNTNVIDATPASEDDDNDRP